MKALILALVMIWTAWVVGHAQDPPAGTPTVWHDEVGGDGGAWVPM